jgi:hypothetical protein
MSAKIHKYTTPPTSHGDANGHKLLNRAFVVREEVRGQEVDNEPVVLGTGVWRELSSMYIMVLTDGGSHVDPAVS